MDKGLHVGSWGQLQEWKVEHDDPEDTHRHLSHLIGMSIGFLVSSFTSELHQDCTLDTQYLRMIRLHRGTIPKSRY